MSDGNEYRLIREWLARQSEHELRLTLQAAKDGNATAAIVHGNRRLAYQEALEQLPFITQRECKGMPPKAKLLAGKPWRTE